MRLRSSAPGVIVFSLCLPVTLHGQQAGTLSPNIGLYDNRIESFVPPVPYTEVCFKNQQILVDIHPVADSTEGGNCLPGELGWLIEKDPHPADFWELAKAECLKSQMRLPEPFELLLSCRNSASFNLSGLTGVDYEWGSNTAVPAGVPGAANSFGTAVSLFGWQGCRDGHWGWIGRPDQQATKARFRCVR